MKMFDTAFAVKTIESDAKEAGVTDGHAAQFWEWLTEVKFASTGGEFTHTNVTEILRTIPALVKEFQEHSRRQYLSWAAGVQGAHEDFS